LVLLGEPKLYQNSGDFTRNGNIEEGICTRIDGCKVVSGQCPTCSVEKVWELKWTPSQGQYFL